MLRIAHWPKKDPDDVLDHSLDWTEWLEGDTIVASLWDVPAGITMVSQAFAARATSIWLSGGTSGQNYLLLNRITTARGRIRDQVVQLPVWAP